MLLTIKIPTMCEAVYQIEAGSEAEAIDMILEGKAELIEMENFKQDFNYHNWEYLHD